MNRKLKKTGEVMVKNMKESAASVLPIVSIIALLCFTFLPVTTDLMLAFLVGSLLLIVGMGIFTLGAETSMTPIGNRLGTAMTKSRSMPLILIVSFILGAAVTIAEPDLQVLAQNVPHINSTVLIVTVGVGVGFFLSLCMLRILLGIRLRWLLLISYAVVIIAAVFVDPSQWGIAFDSGGVTTGPMTVPFILALGVGVSNIRSDSKAESDSFGLVALCSIGPVLSVLLLSFFYRGDGASTASETLSWLTTTEMGASYVRAVPVYMLEMAKSLAPIFIIFLIAQICWFRLEFLGFLRILIGIAYTYVGLVLFLTGVNVGFSSLGSMLGALIASRDGFVLIPIAMVLGWFIISAEPAVYVLEKQVEEISSGAIPGGAIKLSLSVAISLAMGMAMLRVLTGVSILYFVVPGYLIALALSFVVPDIFTAIAFDSGGVASGPLTATFMLPLAIGASSALGGNVLTDAFGLIALVAMMPLITIQAMGAFYTVRDKLTAKAPEPDYTEIIELWE